MNKKIINNPLILSLALCLLPTILCSFIYNKLPDKIPTHFDINGNIILPLEYDTIGYSSGVSGKVVNSLLIVPSYKGIVFGKDYLIPDGRSTKKVRYYGIYDNKGTELIPTRLTNAYFVVNAGVNTYYMEYQGQTLNIEEYLEAHMVNNAQNNTADNNQTQTDNNTIGNIISE